MRASIEETSSIPASAPWPTWLPGWKLYIAPGVGLKRLKAVHVNDSMNVLGAHKDRHEKIGKGRIGLEAFRRIVNHPALSRLPLYLETPCDLQGYRDEIALMKGLRTA